MYSWWFSSYLLLSSLRGHKYVCCLRGHTATEPRSTAPPGPDSYTWRQEYLSRNKVFSRSRYHDELLVLTLDHISLEYRDSVYINLLTYISFHSQPCNQNRFHHMSSQDNIFRLFIFAFQPICETDLSICSFCLGHWYIGCTLHRTIFFCQKPICIKSESKTFVTSRIASNARQRVVLLGPTESAPAESNCNKSATVPYLALGTNSTSTSTNSTSSNTSTSDRLTWHPTPALDRCCALNMCHR